MSKTTKNSTKVIVNILRTGMISSTERRNFIEGVIGEYFLYLFIFSIGRF